MILLLTLHVLTMYFYACLSKNVLKHGASGKKGTLSCGEAFGADKKLQDSMIYMYSMYRQCFYQ